MISEYTLIFSENISTSLLQLTSDSEERAFIAKSVANESIICYTKISTFMTTELTPLIARNDIVYVHKMYQ